MSSFFMFFNYQPESYIGKLFYIGFPNGICLRHSGTSS